MIEVQLTRPLLYSLLRWISETGAPNERFPTSTTASYTTDANRTKSAQNRFFKCGDGLDRTTPPVLCVFRSRRGKLSWPNAYRTLSIAFLADTREEINGFVTISLVWTVLPPQISHDALYRYLMQNQGTSGTWECLLYIHLPCVFMLKLSRIETVTCLLNDGIYSF